MIVIFFSDRLFDYVKPFHTSFPSAEVPQGEVSWFTKLMPLVRLMAHHDDVVCWMVERVVSINLYYYSYALSQYSIR
jgi:hypothetical protein